MVLNMQVFCKGGCFFKDSLALVPTVVCTIYFCCCFQEDNVFLVYSGWQDWHTSPKHIYSEVSLTDFIRVYFEICLGLQPKALIFALLVQELQNSFFSVSML